MKGRVFLLLAVILASLAIWGYRRAIEDPIGKGQGAGISIEPKEWDFGEVDRSAVVVHDFTVHNRGDQTLEIRRLSTSCGCTTAQIGRQRIEPGEETILRVTYDTNAMKHERGQIERNVFLQSNDRDNPQVVVTIRADVK